MGAQGFAAAVRRLYPHAGVKLRSGEHHEAVHVSTRTDYYTEMQSLASDTGMKLREKTAGNDATGEATYLFVPKGT